MYNKGLQLQKSYKYANLQKFCKSLIPGFESKYKIPNFFSFLDSVSKHDPVLVTMTKLLDIFLFRKFCKINIDFFAFHLFLLLTCMGLIKKLFFFVTKMYKIRKSFSKKIGHKNNFLICDHIKILEPTDL
jgi:hypothetical protein